MLELLGVVLLIVGVAVGFASARQITAANRGVKIPWSGRIPNQPRSAPLLRGLAGLLSIVGTLCLFSVLGVGLIPVVFAATASPLLVFVLHNRRLATTG